MVNILSMTILALASAGLVFAQVSGEVPVQEDPPESSETIEEGASEDAGGETGTASDQAADAGADPATGDSDIDGSDIDDSDLDDQTYESDDDIFVPSEEIPADEPIPFPSDI